MVLAKVTASGLSTTCSFHVSLCFKYTPSKLPVKGCLSFKASQKEVYREKEKKPQTNEATKLCFERQILCFFFIFIFKLDVAVRSLGLGLSL